MSHDVTGYFFLPITKDKVKRKASFPIYQREHFFSYFVQGPHLSKTKIHSYSEATPVVANLQTQHRI